MDRVDTMPSKAILMEAIIATMELLGVSAKTSEIDEGVASSLHLSDDLLTLEDDSSTGTVYRYKMRWARTELRQKGVIVNLSRGIWALVKK